MSSDEIAQRLARYEASLKNMDANNNGKIDPDEASDPQAKNQLDRIFGRIGKEPHYPMAISEILQGLEAYYRSRGNANGAGASTSGGSPPSGSSSVAAPSSGGYSNSAASQPVNSPVSGTAGTTVTMASPSEQAAPSPASAALPTVSSPGVSSTAASSPADAKPAPRKLGRFKTARERLPPGLPDWFLEKDVHGDGQVTMAEFTDNWTPEKVAEFARYDLNHDGIITAAECLKVEKAKAK